MLTGELRGQIDRIWDAFWSGGISNPLEVIEQITYLLFVKRLDDLHTLAENKARATNKPIEQPVFPATKAGDTLRWSRFKNLGPSAMFDAVSGKVFTFLRQLGGEDSTYAANMEKARFSDFLYLALLHPAFSRHCKPTETTVPHISPKENRGYSLPLPPLPLQQEFARRVAAVEGLRAGQRGAISKLDELFAALQHWAFRGEL